MKVFLKTFFFSVSLGMVAYSAQATTVAKIGSKTISLQELKDLYQKAPTQVRSAPFEVVFRLLRDQKVLEALLKSDIEEETRAMGIDAKALLASVKDAEIREAAIVTLGNTIMQVLLKRKIESKIKDDKLRALYNELTQKMKNQKEFEVGLIVVNDKTAADKVLGQLNAGKDFAEVAKEYSVEPNTKKAGGNVGYLVEGAIVEVLGPEVANSLKILKDNVHSKKAIKTKDGKYLVVRRGNARNAVVPPYDQIKDQLKNLYAPKALTEYTDELAKKANVKVYTMDGKEDVFKPLSGPAKEAGAQAGAV